MIPHKEQWYYIVVTKLSALLRGVTLIRNAAFYCVNFLHSFRTKNVLLIIKEYAEIKTFAVLEHLLKKMLLFFTIYMYQYCLSVIYVDLDSLIKKASACKNNPEKLSTTKVKKHILHGYSTPTISAFNDIENKHMYKEVKIA